MRALLLATALALPLAAVPAAAQRLCTEPVSPTCLDVEATFETDRGRKRCRRDVEEYAQAVEQYVACLRDKAQGKEQHAEELRERFRCKADGGAGCP